MIPISYNAASTSTFNLHKFVINQIQVKRTLKICMKKEKIQQNCGFLMVEHLGMTPPLDGNNSFFTSSLREKQPKPGFIWQGNRILNLLKGKLVKVFKKNIHFHRGTKSSYSVHFDTNDQVHRGYCTWMQKYTCFFVWWRTLTISHLKVLI